MQNKNEKRVPELRFKGFVDDWEQRKLGEVASIFDGTHQTPHYTESGVMFLSVENIKTLQSEKYISMENFEGEFKVRPEYGDVLMTRIGDIGTANVVRTNTQIAYYVSLALLKAIDTDSDFLAISIASPFVQKGLWMRTLHIAFPKKINKNEIEKVDIIVPRKEEQQKIGKFFTNLDHLIALHKRKLDLLKQMKQGYLQQMFPKNGEKVPKLRFANFEGDWEERKLGELGKVFTGNTPSTTDKENWSSNNKGYIWITPTDINKLLISNSERCLTDKGWSKARTVPANSVLITSIASIGKNAINIVPAAFNQQINAIVPKENASYFVLSAMEKDTVRFAGIAGKTATSIISKKWFEAFKIYVPEYKEQIEVGQLFSFIDYMTSLYQQKVYNITLQRKTYLQLIFI